MSNEKRVDLRAEVLNVFGIVYSMGYKWDGLGFLDYELVLRIYR